MWLCAQGRPFSSWRLPHSQLRMKFRCLFIIAVHSSTSSFLLVFFFKCSRHLLISSNPPPEVASVPECRQELLKLV